MMRMSCTPFSRNRAPASKPPNPPPMTSASTSSWRGCAFDLGFDIRIFDEAREIPFDLDVLLVAVRTQSLVALHSIALAHRVWIEIDRFPGCGRGLARIGRRHGSSLSVQAPGIAQAVGRAVVGPAGRPDNRRRKREGWKAPSATGISREARVLGPIGDRSSGRAERCVRSQSAERRSSSDKIGASARPASTASASPSSSRPSRRTSGAPMRAASAVRSSGWV